MLDQKILTKISNGLRSKQKVFIFNLKNRNISVGDMASELESKFKKYKVSRVEFLNCGAKVIVTFVKRINNVQSH